MPMQPHRTGILGNSNESVMSILERLNRLLSSRRSVIHYRCARCGETVTYRADVVETDCPRCASTELIDLDE